jgi:hypothetical protein
VRVRCAPKMAPEAPTEGLGDMRKLSTLPTKPLAMYVPTKHGRPTAASYAGPTACSEYEFTCHRTATNRSRIVTLVLARLER